MNRFSSIVSRNLKSGLVRSTRALAGIPMDDVLMGLSEDHIELRNSVRGFLETELG